MLKTQYRAMTSMTALVAAMALPVVAHAQDAAVPPAAAGQDNIDRAAGDETGEIVVTAQRRAEASRDVPISVTSLSTQQLTVANVRSLADTAKLTPGLRFDSQGPAVQPTIRGVGTAITTSGGGPNVGIYVDGFFQSNTYVSDFQLTKVRNIQVLKGPQGTLFGRNTTGGAILVTTADPSTTPGGEFRVSYGRFGSLRAQAYATAGLTDRIAMDVEGAYSYGNGFQTDVLTGNDHVGQYRNWSFRTGLKAAVSDDVSVLLRYIHQDSNDPNTQLVNAFVDRDGRAGFLDKVSAAGKAFYGRGDTVGKPLVFFFAPAGTVATAPGDIAINGPASFRAKSDVFQGTIRADLGFADLTSYSQYRRDDTPYFGDLDATALPIFSIFVGVVDKTYSQEFLLTSKPGSRLQWTAGANYFQVHDTWDVNASFGTPFADFGGSSTLTRSYAGFADLTYEVNDKLFLTVGARYSHDAVSDAYFKTNFFGQPYTGPNGESIPTTGIPPETKIFVKDLKNDSLTPRAVIRYKPTGDMSAYASFTRGYKAGILNVGGRSAQTIAPEKISAYEIGYKYDDRIFAIDLAGYYYDYKDLQVSSYQDGAAQIRNAASSEIYGAEAQARYRVSQAFNLSAGVAYTHARYKSFVNAPYYSYCDPVAPSSPALACMGGAAGAGALTQTTADASGLHMQRAPDFTANLGASYGLPLAGGRLMLSGNLYYTSSFYFDPTEQFRQKGYEVLALRAEWTDPTEHFTAAVYGDNVTNRRYRTQGLFNTLGIASVWNAPVTYGASLGYKF